jgi:hypothetical protein
MFRFAEWGHERVGAAMSSKDLFKLSRVVVDVRFTMARELVTDGR